MVENRELLNGDSIACVGPAASPTPAETNDADSNGDTHPKSKHRPTPRACRMLRYLCVVSWWIMCRQG